MSRKLYTFRGGLHLPGYKGLSNQHAIQQLPIPQSLTLPLQQHIGRPAISVVSVGDHVLKGEVIARYDGEVSAPFHAPTSGFVTAMNNTPFPHPSQMEIQAITITPDGNDQWGELSPVPDYHSCEPAEIRKVIRNAGIVGLGGAGFPAHVKLNPGSRTATDTLIINAAECEPYITCDDRLMRERAREIISGVRIMRHAVHALQAVIGIEDNKLDAFTALVHALENSGVHDIEIVRIPTIYPAGGEKQLIRVLTGKEVPSQGIPLDVGVVCQNIATAYAVQQAVIEGKPLISRIVTVSGEAVNSPGNFESLIGTPFSDLLQAAGGETVHSPQLTVGGPMMGIVVPHLNIPMIKTSNALLVQNPNFNHKELSCIRCGACAEVCPVGLQPQQLYWHSRAKEFDKVQEQNLFDCIDCGCCAWVCPSKIPLVHYFRFAKTAIWNQERNREAADRARERHDQRQDRLDREKAERAAKMMQKKAALKKRPETAKGADSKKAAIEAALQRARAKKEAIQNKDTMITDASIKDDLIENSDKISPPHNDVTPS